MTRRRGGATVGATSGRRFEILEGLANGSAADCLTAGSMPGSGTYYCLGCGTQLTLREPEPLPACAECGHRRFRRDSIFTAHQDHAGATAEFELGEILGAPNWLQEIRSGLPSGREHLAWCGDDDGPCVYTVRRGWTRIGRNHNADICLDDPTVSRRHALIVAKPDKGLWVMDDRSLNGVFVNGRKVDWAPLGERSELTIGRFRLFPVRS